MRNSIRTRLAITFVALAVGLLLLVGIVLAWQSYVTEQEQALILQSERAQRIATQVLSFMQIQENALTELVSVRGLSDLDKDHQTQLLSELLAFSNVFSSLALVDGNGLEKIVVASTEIANQLQNLSTADEFTIPKSTKQIYYGPVQFSEKSGEPYMVIAVPITNVRTGDVTSVLSAEVRLKPVWDLLANSSLGKGSSAYIVDSSDRVVAHNNPSVVLRNTLFRIPEQDGVHNGVSGTSVVLATDQINLGEQSFTVVTETSTEEAFASIFRTELIIFALLMIAMAIAGGLGWIAAGQIVRPIEDLAATAHDISLGDLTKKAVVARRDEIGNLAEAFNSMTSQLRDLIGSLEQRVEERTSNLTAKTLELEDASKKLENRASQLTAVSVVARGVTTMRDTNQLLPKITEVISQQFGFYHVGIFLNDEAKQYSVLRATNSEGGARMLAQGHRLKIGQVGIVGDVASTGNPRIALDTGDDAVFFNNPNLPETKSEMALPLKVGERIIGVLDVQSTASGAFKPEDVEILSILADQVSIAIENANLFEGAQAAIQKYVETSWRYFMVQSPQLGYQFSNNVVQPLVKPLDRPEITAVLESGQTVTDSSPEIRLPIPTLAMPIKVRGEIIGVLDIRSINPNRTWDNVDITTAQTIADRLAFALENARLINESQKRVARERAISDMTTRIGSSSDVDTILQQTVQELGRLIGNSEVVIQINKELDRQPEG
jgi:GAF domain-containing protein/HAMP domain-containing protein